MENELKNQESQENQERNEEVVTNQAPARYEVTERFPDISNQKCVIGGLQGTGKTIYTKNLMNFHSYRVLVYCKHFKDYADMPDNFIIVVPKDFYNDIEDFIKLAIELGKQGKIDGVLIDEFDMIYRNNSDLKQNMNDLVLNHRHYGLFLCVVTRRPQDIPPKLFESSKYKVFFAIEGENVQSKLNGLGHKLGDKVSELKIDSFECYIKEVGYSPYLINTFDESLKK